jgi:TetR/AcrR family transcriptional regulator
MEKTIRDKALDAATRLFAEKGFAGVSLQDAAEAAGVDVAEVEELFPSQMRLYESVLEAQFSFYAARIGAAFDGDELPTKKIELFAQFMCDVHRQAPCFFLLFYRELLNPSPYFETIVKKSIQHVAYLSDNNIGRGIQKGTFKRGVNPANATMMLAGMFHYYFLAGRLAGSLLPDAANDAEYLSQALEVFLSGIRKGAK